MRINCRHCNKKMNLGEFLAYAETYLLKYLIIPVVVPFLIAAIKDRLQTTTRGFFDDTMAGLANNFSIACSNCKNAETPWDPAPEELPDKSIKKNKNISI